jgi:hypothetical protein
MIKKISLWVSGAGAAIAGMVMTVAAHAQSIAPGDLSVPTSTVHDLLASASSILTDPGILGIIAVAIALPLVFYFVRQVIGLLPKSRAAR